MVAITYNDRIYELRVLETKPGNAVSIIECDMNVEFAPPVGYSDPSERKQSSKDANADDADSEENQEFFAEIDEFVPFAGQGVR